MSKPRGTTIQQRFGFKDSDLTTPLHDEILLWLDENIEQVILLHILDQKDVTKWSEEAIAKGSAKMFACIEVMKARWSKTLPGDDLLDWTLPPVPKRNSDLRIQVTWERPIATESKNKYIIGFVDLSVVFSLDILSTNIKTGGRLDVSGKWKEDYTTWDNALPRWDVDSREYLYHFEIKSTIKSLGEVIRQIRMYQEYTKGKFLIVCPDDRFEKQIKSQGIGFVKYEPKNKQAEMAL